MLFLFGVLALLPLLAEATGAVPPATAVTGTTSLEAIATGVLTRNLGTEGFGCGTSSGDGERRKGAFFTTAFTRGREGLGFAAFCDERRAKRVAKNETFMTLEIVVKSTTAMLRTEVSALDVNVP